MSVSVPIEKLTDKALTLEIADDGKEILVRWLGRSTARDPRAFLKPVLTRVLETSLRDHRRLILDFRELEYFNSSTITPIVRLLQQAKAAGGQVTVRYRGDLKWQQLSFSALQMFHDAGTGVLLEAS